MKPEQSREPSLAELFTAGLDKAREIGGEIWDGAKPMFDKGRDEIASALFRGDAFVMYGSHSKETEHDKGMPHGQVEAGHEMTKEPEKEVELDEPEMEMER